MTEPTHEAPVRHSLVRPVLIAGAETGPAVLELVVIVLLAFGFQVSIYSIAAAGLLGSLSHLLLLRAAKSDPQLCALYTRHIRFQRFYSATSHPTASAARTAPSWY
jgi:type IV secretory pathway TrbD component